MQSPFSRSEGVAKNKGFLILRKLSTVLRSLLFLIKFFSKLKGVVVAADSAYSHSASDEDAKNNYLFLSQLTDIFNPSDSSFTVKISCIHLSKCNVQDDFLQLESDFLVLPDFSYFYYNLNFLKSLINFTTSARFLARVMHSMFQY